VSAPKLHQSSKGLSQRQYRSSAQLGFLVQLVLAMSLCLGLAVLVFVERIESTVLETSFYTRHLEQAGSFRLIADEYLPRVARSRLEKQFPGITEAAVDETLELLRSVLNRGYFRAQAQEFSRILVRWAQEDSPFTVKIHVEDRIAAASTVVSSRLPSSVIAGRIYRWAIGRAVDEIMTRSARLPFGIPVDRVLWLAAIQTAFPQTWVAQKSVAKLPLLTAFLSGERETLDFVIPLYERQGEIARALRFLVARSNSLDFLREHVLLPAIRESAQDQVLLESTALSLSRDEIADAFDRALTSQWVREREGDIVELVVAYLVGERDVLQLSVPLEPLKHSATQQLEETVWKKLEAHYEALPECQNGGAGSPFSWPSWSCRPAGVGFGLLRLFSGVDLHGRIRRKLDERIPQQWTYSEQRSRDAIGEPAWDNIERARSWLKHGYPLRLDELRMFLRRGQDDVLEQVLLVTRHGWTFEQAEIASALRRWVGDDAEQRVEGVLHWTRGMHEWRPALWLFVLLCVAFLFVSWSPRERFCRFAYVVFGAALLGMGASALLASRLDLPATVEPSQSLALMESLSELLPSVLEGMAEEFFETWQLRNLELMSVSLLLFVAGRVRRRVCALPGPSSSVL
jgi:hypothetical protein